MRRSSLKARVTLIGAALATLLVWAVLMTSYLVVAAGMADVAMNETAGLAGRAASLVRREVSAAQSDAAQSGLRGEEAVNAAEVTFSQSIPDRFGVGQALLGGGFAFYDPADDQPRYFSHQSAVVQAGEERARAVREDMSVAHVIGGRPMLMNVLMEPDLGVYVVHVPFKRPSGATWVLDVVYDPAREAAAIEQIRAPMLWVSTVAILMTAVILRWSTGWVLRLVRELRVAAESVDAGQLDVRLPESGRNEISDLARSINSLIERLRQRSEAQTRFVADASHELATPVAGIRGYVSILRGWGADDADVREEALDAIDRESERMLRLTRQLLALIRSEQEMAFHSVRHDVNAGVREVLAGAATRYADKGLEFVGPDEGALMLYGDPERMIEVIGILVDNAAKYTPGGGRVSVTTSRRKGDVLIEVSDTGPGIPPEELPSIFERFYRSDSARWTRSGGFGLGLAIARRIIESAGGLLDVTSEVGVGTTFTIRVPRGRD